MKDEILKLEILVLLLLYRCRFQNFLNNLVEIEKDRIIEVEDRERQHAKKTGTIPKATIRSIEKISNPRDRDGHNKYRHKE